MTVKDEELAKLESLSADWASFKLGLVEAERRLDKAKGDFKEELLQSLSDFNAQTESLRQDFERNGPFADGFSAGRAVELISEYEAQVASLRAKEAQMLPGLGIFDIEPPANKETAQTERELELLKQVWEMRREWDESWNQWKFGKFASIEISSMEGSAAAFSRRIYKQQKEVKGWHALDALKDSVDQFKKTLPLIVDLRNDALRDRHWSQLMEEIGAPPARPCAPCPPLRAPFPPSRCCSVPPPEARLCSPRSPVLNCTTAALRAPRTPRAQTRPSTRTRTTSRWSASSRSASTRTSTSSAPSPTRRPRSSRSSRRSPSSTSSSPSCPSSSSSTRAATR